MHLQGEEEVKAGGPHEEAREGVVEEAGGDTEWIAESVLNLGYKVS